jgi:hypothetical protein
LHEHGARQCGERIEHRFEGSDAVGNATDAGVNRDARDAGATGLRLRQQPRSGEGCAPGQRVLVMVLDHHDGEVVELGRTGQGDKRPMRGGDAAGAVIERLVAYVLDAGLASRSGVSSVGVSSA